MPMAMMAMMQVVWVWLTQTTSPMQAVWWTQWLLLVIRTLMVLVMVVMVVVVMVILMVAVIVVVMEEMVIVAMVGIALVLVWNKYKG